MPRNPRKFKIRRETQKPRIGGCPKCHSRSATYLGRDEIHSKKYIAAIPKVLEAESESHEIVAYYKCKNCGQDYYTEPVRGR